METPFVVGLGASAGGLGALERFFKKVSTDTGAAFVVVVHPSPDFESLMPELLSRHTEMPVEAVTDGAAVLADRVYIIPPRSSMELRDGQLCLVAPDRSPGRDLNLPINLFFFSLARDAGARSAAVVLSGAGTDGSGGLPAVAQQGGTILVQDPTDAQFDGMPRAALETGLVDVVGQVEQLAETIGHLTRPPGASDDGSPPAPGSLPAEELERLHALIEARHPSCRFLGATTVSRRVSRRAQLAGQADVESYLDLLTTNPQELDALRRDLFVGFTSFFRDPRAFESLRQEALPQLLADGSTDPLRIWVPACSTGQEVYTLVMCCLEALEAAGQNRHLKVFATDVNERALPFASRGIYSAEEVAWLPEGLLAKYFEPRGVEFVVSPRIRSGVIFSSHNVVEDAPFGRMDLVSCRNLLIYLTDAAKQETLRSLVSALKPDRGILMLGASEMPTPFEPYVDAISSARRLYRRGSKSPPLVKPRPLPSPDPTGGVRDRRDTLKEVRTAAELKTLRQALGASFAFDARSAALIDDENRLLTVLHDAQGLFKLPTGDASLHVERILPAPHAAALWSARNHLREGHPHPVPVVTPDGAPALDLRLVPLEVPEGSAPKLLLVIGARAAPAGPRAEAPWAEGDAEAVAQLQATLARTQTSLQETIEELRSTDEERVASNEELQSTHEELQSLNQEVYTVNAELQRKNRDLEVITADLDNLLDALDVGTVYLDEDLTIRRYNARFTRIVELRASDLGRSIESFATGVNFLEPVRRALAEDRAVEQHLRDAEGALLLMRARPYRTQPDGPQQGDAEGVVVTFVDVTALKNSEEAASLLGERLFATNQSLKDQVEQLEGIFSATAHDLRKPLLSIDAFMQGVREQLGREPPDVEAALPKLGRLEGKIRQLRTILDELTKLSEISRADQIMESLELDAWLDAQLESYAERAENAGLQLRYAADPMTVRAAAAAAAIALRNLVDNAFVHGATAEQPRITVQAILRDGMLELVVTDNGRGIPPEHHDRVFELFSRLHPEASEGTGVGLVGARRAVERAGGKLFLESEAGKGARFTVRLPTERVAGSAQAGVAGPRNLKVLLVEDDALDAKQTRLSLDEAVVTWVATLADAESASLRMRFDLILLDLSLPDGPGLSAVTTLRSGRNARTPIAVLTGLADGISERLLRSLEVAAVIEKGRSQGPGIRALVGQLLGAPAPVGEDARSAARTRAAPPPAPDTGESGPASA